MRARASRAIPAALRTPAATSAAMSSVESRSNEDMRTQPDRALRAAGPPHAGDRRDGPLEPVLEGEGDRADDLAGRNVLLTGLAGPGGVGVARVHAGLVEQVGAG